MKWHPSEMQWMQRVHLPKVHAIHMHPIHWCAQHPLILALLIAGLVAATLFFLASRTDSGISIETLRPFGSPPASSYGGEY